MEGIIEPQAESDQVWLNSYEPEVPHTIEIPDLTLPEFFERTARAYPNNTATIFFGQRLTYAQIEAQANQFAFGLQAIGVKPGDRVALLLPNCPQFLIALYGALKMGAVVVPQNPVSAARELNAQFNDAGVETVVILGAIAQRVQEAMSGTQVKRVILTDVQDYLPPVMSLMQSVKSRREEAAGLSSNPNSLSFLGLIRDSEIEYTRPQIAPDDTALLLYTGGTTGTPRAVMLSHRNLVANALQMNAWVWDAREERKEAFLAVVPFFQCYGLTVVMNLAISVGGALILLPRFTIKEVLRSITRFRPTIFPGVPAIYSAIANHPLAQRYDLRSIRVCISGEMPLPTEIAQTFESVTGARLVEAYGLTEASPVTHCNPVHGERGVGSIGLPIPLTDARVVDHETRTPMPIGEVGVLVVRGPQVMQGYWGQEEDTAAVLQDGWLYTGDMARQDAHGYFYVVARKNDLIVVDGQYVYPREIEEVLLQCDKVQEVVVAGVPNRQGDEIIKAYVVLKADMEVTERELRAFCSERLENHKVPARIEFREGLPKTGYGKYLRRELIQEERERLNLQ